jgi:hypothetical protein
MLRARLPVDQSQEFERSLQNFSHRTHVAFIQSAAEWWTGAGAANSAVKSAIQIHEEKWFMSTIT